jgi:hypothetical protein
MKPKFQYYIVPADALFDKRVTPALLRTLNILSYVSSARQEKASWYSYRTLSEISGVDPRNLRRQIAKLCEFGYVEKKMRKRADGGNTSNYYRVNFQFSDLTNDAPEEPSGVVQDFPQGMGKEYPHMNNEKKNNEKENKKNINKKSSFAKGRKGKRTLLAWEEIVGTKLCVQQLKTWIRSNKIDERKIPALIDEFRDQMIAGGNEYADFISAFQVWLRRGYLSKRLDEVQHKEESRGGVVIQDKGVSL